jgi:uncharacterized membrane protein
VAAAADPPVLSAVFTNVRIYWNNHHHMLREVKHVGGWVLRANLHLLFRLSLIPFATGFTEESGFEPIPVALYAFDLLMCGLAHTLLARAMINEHGRDSAFARALGLDPKGKISLLAYLVAISLAFLTVWISVGLFLLVAGMWIVPDRRFVKVALGAALQTAPADVCASPPPFRFPASVRSCMAT